MSSRKSLSKKSFNLKHSKDNITKQRNEGEYNEGRAMDVSTPEHELTDLREKQKEIHQKYLKSLEDSENSIVEKYIKLLFKEVEKTYKGTRTENFSDENLEDKITDIASKISNRSNVILETKDKQFSVEIWSDGAGYFPLFPVDTPPNIDEIREFLVREGESYKSNKLIKYTSLKDNENIGWAIRQNEETIQRIVKSANNQTELLRHTLTITKDFLGRLKRFKLENIEKMSKGEILEKFKTEEYHIYEQS
jgi:hypothetical protein